MPSKIINILFGIAIGFASLVFGFFWSFGECFKKDCTAAEEFSWIWIPAVVAPIAVLIIKKTGYPGRLFASNENQPINQSSQSVSITRIITLLFIAMVIIGLIQTLGSSIIGLW